MNQDEKRDLTVISLLGAGLGAIGIFGNYCPCLTECLKNGNDPRFVGSLRRAYTASWLLALGFGGLVSVADESFVPLVAAAGAGVVMTCVYESELPPHHRLTSPLQLLSPAPAQLL